MMLRRSMLVCAVMAAPTAVLGCSADDGGGSAGDGSSTGGTEVGTTGGPASTSAAPTSAGSGAVDSSGGGPGSDSSGAGSSSGGGDTTGGGAATCIDAMYLGGAGPGPSYDNVTIGSHCQGTNHQDIVGVERVVFVGDSVTVGTRPTAAADFYRSIVADELATMFGLMPPDVLWKQANPLTGQAVVQESGDFASCAEWGARNDDLMAQLGSCFSDPTDFDKTTLIVLTMGGNDLSSIIQDAIGGVPADQLLMEVQSMLAFHEEAMNWIVDPARFPNGVFVVAGNPYEFTDFSADVLSCPAAGVAGFNMNPPEPEMLSAGYVLMLSEYARIAAETGTDVVFMSEGFCGHGFHADDPANVCYRGPGNETWFDLSCIHPTPTGHGELAQMFLDVIAE